MNSCREGPSTSTPTAPAMIPTASVARTRQRSMSGCSIRERPIKFADLLGETVQVFTSDCSWTRVYKEANQRRQG